MDNFTIRANAVKKIENLLNGAVKIVLHKYTDETGSIRRYLSVNDVVSVLKSKKCIVSANAKNKALEGIESLSIEVNSKCITAYFEGASIPTELNAEEKDLTAFESLASDFNVLFTNEEKQLIIDSFSEAGLINEVNFLEKQPVKDNVIVCDFKSKMILK